MNILSLNMNGLGLADFKLRWVSNLVNKHNSSVVGLQETKRNFFSDLMVKRIWKSTDFDFVTSNSVGQAGGLISIWNNNLFRKSHSICREDCIVIQGSWIENNVQVCFFNIYASQNPVKRAELWNFVNGILLNWSGVAIVFGDFNEVRSGMERKGSVLDERSTKIFNSFITSNNLIDVKMGGSAFTWIKGRGSKMSKLDRFLITESFGDVWPNFEALTETRMYSDHKPIVLKQINRDYGISPFKFFNSWLEEEELEEIVKKTWSEFSIDGQHKKLFIIM